MTFYQSVLTVLLSMLGSSVVASYVSHRLATGEKERGVKRDKMEKMYMYSIQHRNMLASTTAMLVSYYDGKMSQADFLKQFNEDNVARAEAGNYVLLLCGLYFPQLTPAFAGLLKLADTISRQASRVLPPHDILKPEAIPNSDKMVEVYALLTSLVEAHEEFTKRALEEAEKLTKY